MIFSKRSQISNVVNFACKLFFNNNHSMEGKLKCLIHNRNIKESSDLIKLNVKGEHLKYPLVWLRENCQCDQCFHKTAKSRVIDWTNFKIDVKPIQLDEDTNSITIVWDDGHSSQYDLDWLKFRSFRVEDQLAYSNKFYRPKKILWKGEQFEDIFKRYDYNNILESDRIMYDFLLNLSVYGVALIENTPDRETAVDNLVNKIGFIKRTHYGEKYTVQQVVDTNNVAYLTSNLQMHTDLPYYDYCPGVNVLHCRVQTNCNGGENILADCHYVANYMKQCHPRAYDLLTNIEVEWSDIGVEDGKEFYKLHRSPVIILDRRGEIIGTKFSIPQRGSHFLGNIEDVTPWYEAHALFLKLSHDFAAKFRTDAGKTLVFDNSRLLHGRNAYVDSKNNIRKVIGAFVDWDEIYSRLRCLKLSLDDTSFNCQTRKTAK